MRLKKVQCFYLINKSIKPKASRLFKPIKCFKKYQNLAMVTIVKKFELLNIDLLQRLKIEKSYYCITLV